ncbi:hypothetical protein H072_10090 [Dactylellina haptotyla CBS 200.50]|uniref:Uncharacterized protein n=1 Tax=Dactylellina haptotyla (strain CBS 200.50) TaxID=1284197 RepID=S8BMG2_DACHA|nr:hypothetical protein H072_10090 [Dactylellina haptotyla CBS 200.50]
MSNPISLIHTSYILCFLIVRVAAADNNNGDFNYTAPDAVVLRNRDCQTLLQHNRTLYQEIVYKGHITNYYGSPDADAQLVAITYTGCVKVCGNHWKNDTQTTLDLLLDWILPALGLITQMPWESNRNSVTGIWLARWIGSPIAALTFCLWDVKIAGRCSKLVNLSTKYRYRAYHSEVLRAETEAQEERVAFGEARDKFYILLVMNQFELKASAENYLTPEELINACERALYGKGVVNGVDLVAERRRIADDLRDRRKRGVVPIFLGMGGFFFAMAVAIRKAFSPGEGNGASAFNVGLGMLVGWLPVLYLAAVVDNDHDNKPEFAHAFSKLVSTCHKDGEFISIFGHGEGQGRGRWHYGISQTLMNRVENEFLREWKKRGVINWMTLSTASPVTERKVEFGHWRMIEPLVSSFIIVNGISSGAFILAYFTPPVGLAWRSAAYLTCLSLATLIFIIDIILFKVVRHTFTTPSTRINHGPVYKFFKSPSFRTWANYFLTLLEVLNNLILCLLVIAMAGGLFNFCAGAAVDRGGPGGGLVILNSSEFYMKYFDVTGYYEIGIMPGMLLMGISSLYLIEQWATQSFLWARNDDSAMIGWKRTRRWKWFYTLGGILESGESLGWFM